MEPLCSIIGQGTSLVSSVPYSAKIRNRVSAGLMVAREGGRVGGGITIAWIIIPSRGVRQTPSQLKNATKTGMRFGCRRN